LTCSAQRPPRLASPRFASLAPPTIIALHHALRGGAAGVTDARALRRVAAAAPTPNAAPSIPLPSPFPPIHPYPRISDQPTRCAGASHTHTHTHTRTHARTYVHCSNTTARTLHNIPRYVRTHIHPSIHPSILSIDAPRRPSRAIHPGTGHPCARFSQDRQVPIPSDKYRCQNRLATRVLAAPRLTQSPRYGQRARCKDAPASQCEEARARPGRCCGYLPMQQCGAADTCALACRCGRGRAAGDSPFFSFLPSPY
jgi:hypothetical protein